MSFKSMATVLRGPMAAQRQQLIDQVTSPPRSGARLGERVRLPLLGEVLEELSDIAA